MGLTFLQPAFLLGALAAAVPVVIHLIARRQALVHRFPAVRFLLLADKRTARKFRLRQWLLLALRVLAILLLTFTLARPRLTGDEVQAAAALPPQATVVLVDNSLSMQYRDSQESRLERAKTLAARLLRSLRPQDSAAILPLLDAAEETESQPFFSHDQATLHEQLTAIRPQHGAVDLVRTFTRAFTLLQERTAARRQIVFLTDLTVQDWEGFHLSRFTVVPEHVVLHVLRLGGPQRDGNVLIEDIRIREAPFIEQVPLEVTVLVRNDSGEALRNLPLDLFLGARKIGQQLVDLGPDERVAVPFRLMAPQAGRHWGEVRLAGDHYAEDDQFYYALRTVAPARVLVVDGDPGTLLFDSEIFYLMNALQPTGTLGRPAFYPKPVTWEGLGQERLEDFRVIVLCNVEALPAQLRHRLYQFVIEGGGLLFVVGNRVEAGRYNAIFHRADTPLLPLALGAAVQRPQTQPARIADVDASHEALRLFAADAALLQWGKFYRYLSVEGLQEAVGVRVLLRLQDEAPLLVEKGLGRGQVMLFTSTADRDWTDLPTRTAYVPLMHGVIGSLAQLAAAVQYSGVLMPAPFEVRGQHEDIDATVTIQTADGQQRLSRYTQEEGMQVRARVAAYTVPGIYRLLTPNGQDLLPVNATRAESHFEKLHATDLQARLRPLQVVLEEERALGQSPAGHALPAKELTAMVLLAFIAVLGIENVYANRF